MNKQEAQFQRWIENHLGLIIKVVRTYTASSVDQEDLLQEIFVNLWTSAPNFRGESKETTWIYRVALQTAMVWRRGERRRYKHHSILLSDAARSTIHDETNHVCDHRLIEQLYVAIRQLPKLDASIAIMHLDGLTYQEISEVLEISENYVGVKLTRIRKQLLEQLSDDP